MTRCEHTMRQFKEQAERLRLRARVLDAVGQPVIATDVHGRVKYWNAAAERMYGWGAEEVLGRDLREFAGEAAVPQGSEFREALRRGAGWTGEQTARDKHGRELPVLVTDTPCYDDEGRFIGVVGVSTDISELHAARERAHRRAAQQSAIAQLGQEALDAADLDHVLHRACVVVTRVLDAELAKVLETEPDGEHLWLRAGVGWDKGEVGVTRVPNDRGSQAGYTLLREGPVVVEDVERERRFATPELLQRHRVASGVSVRIGRAQGRVYGVLSAHSRQAREFSEDDVAFLRSVANILGAVIDHHAFSAELERLSLYDSLTHLANRSLLLDRLHHALQIAEHRPGSVLALHVDIDRFKLVNEGLGQAAGDELLSTVGQRIQRAVDTTDTVGRIGGDEFLVVCQHLPGSLTAASAEAVELASRIEEAVTGPYQLADGDVHVSVSIGMALNSGAEDPQELLRNVSTALHRAKQRDRGGVELFDERMREEATERLQLVNELRKAWERREFFLAYQPEIDLRTGEVFAVEALLRWRHPRRGVVTPGSFIDVADDIGLMLQLGPWAIVQACREVARLPPPPEGSPVPVAVNISARQLADEQLVHVVDHALAASGLEPERLFLEITERAILDEPEHAFRVIEELRQRGVRVAIDDFGTGYSSLDHLARLPVDVLKIDRSFVARLPEPGSHRTIVEAIIGLADTLDLTCVAEGVETDDHVADLRRLGCAVGQGWRWSAALPPDALSEWLALRPVARGGAAAGTDPGGAERGRAGPASP